MIISIKQGDKVLCPKCNKVMRIDEIVITPMAEFVICEWCRNAWDIQWLHMFGELAEENTDD